MTSGLAVGRQGSPRWPAGAQRPTSPAGAPKKQMDEIESSTPGGEPSRWQLRLERLRLRFRDPALESAYRADRFRHDLGNIRFAFLAGIALWVTWGLLL